MPATGPLLYRVALAAAGLGLCCVVGTGAAPRGEGPEPTGVRDAQTQAQDQTLAMSKADVERLRAYHERIVKAVVEIPLQASLAELVRPVMQLADARATAATAAAENRAAILAIAFYANGKSLAAIVPEARDWPRAEWRRLRLHTRGDLMQHFTISAAVAAAAGAPIAHAIGLYKEIEDARRGGGFSFSDLTADRAGTTFGLVATQSAESARRLLARIRPGLTEADMMPAITGLPPDLRQADFNKQYRGAGAAEYRRLVAEIDRRIAALPLFQSD